MFSDILLTVDFDRTLTARDATIPRRNLEAIQYFMDNGGAFTVNTGRSIPMSAGSLLPEVPVNVPLLLYNGCAAYDKNTGELSQCMVLPLDPKEVLWDVQNRFPELQVEIQGVAAHYLIRKDPIWEAYCQRYGCPWKYVAPEDLDEPFMKFALYGEFRNDTVASLYEATEEDIALIQRAMEYLETTYGDKVDIFHSCPRLIDVNVKGCSKLAAARTLQRTLGRKILVCVGDGKNDLSMLEGADYAFSPADGVIADRFPNVCVCDEGAVADVIYEKIPEILRK